MGFVMDSLGIFKKRNLNFIESYKELDHIYTFEFEKDNNITWKAGQHGLFQLDDKKIKNPIRPFTIAAAPSEENIKITTWIDDETSEFKQGLRNLKKGMKIKMSGPVGSFYLKDYRPTILIAGGIGITPFRAILKQLDIEGSGDGHHITLFYLNSKGTHLFKNELDEIAQHCSINISYFHTREELNNEVDQFSKTFNNKANYFIAGPKSMIDSTFSNLRKIILQKNILKKIHSLVINDN